MGLLRLRCNAILYPVLFLIAVIVILATMNRASSVYDEGLILTGAMRVGSGEIPHRDFFSTYGPAQFYIVALLFKLLGPSVIAERLWDVCVRAAIATLAFTAVRAHDRPPAGFAAYVACLVWLAAFGSSGFPLFPALLFSLAATLLVSLSLDRERHSARIVAGGACVGLTALFRYDVGGLVGAALLGVLIASAVSRQETFRRTATRSPFLFALGAVAVFGPVALAYLLSGGTIGAFVHDVLSYSANYVHTRHLPFPSLDQLWSDPIALSVYLPPAVLGAALALAASRRREDSLGWVIAAFAAVCAAFYIKGWVRMSVLHTAGAIIFALLLLPLVWRATRGQTARRVAVALCIVLAGIPTVFALQASIANADRNGAFISGLLRGDTTCGAPPYMRRVACLEVGDSWSRAVRFVIDHVAKDERLFVGAGRHDKIFINDNLFYFATRHLPATRWNQYEPGLQTRADVQTAMVAELDRIALRYIVLESDWDNVAEPNASALSSGVTILDDYIHLRYETVGQFGTISVLARRK